MTDRKVLVLSASISLGAGIGKEISDAFHPGHDASWGDLLADALGVVAGGIILHNMP